MELVMQKQELVFGLEKMIKGMFQEGLQESKRTIELN